MGFAGEKSQCPVIESNESCSCENEEVSSGYDHILEEVGQGTGPWFMPCCASSICMDSYGCLCCQISRIFFNQGACSLGFFLEAVLTS
jgi:hypothetical protein